MTVKQKLILEVIYNMYPEACCELNYRTNEQLAIAVILSAQTTDKLVNTVTPSLFETYPTMNTLADAKIKEIESCIQRIGLYHTKAKNIKAFAQELIERHNGSLPDNPHDLKKLSGVGQKTSQVILAEIFRIPALAVDTHVHRVSLRLGLTKKNSNVDQTEKSLKRIIPKEDWIQAHHRILWFGRYHCMSKNPKCSSCVLTDVCRYYKYERKAT